MKGIVAPLLKSARITLQLLPSGTLSGQLEVATAVSQVLLNLISNAKEALEHCDREVKQINIAFAENAEGVTVTVADNGPGIAPEIKPKIFDPYFTTKNQIKEAVLGCR